MKFNDLKNHDLLKDKEISEYCKLGEITESCNKDKFKYRGVYILVDNDDVVYIGSAYARNVRDRLLQYQQTQNSGNSSLYSDLIEGNKCTKDVAYKYIKSLTAYAFYDESLEYKLIKCCDSAVNIAGTKEESHD